MPDGLLPGGVPGYLGDGEVHLGEAFALFWNHRIDPFNGWFIRVPLLPDYVGLLSCFLALPRDGRLGSRHIKMKPYSTTRHSVVKVKGRRFGLIFDLRNLEKFHTLLVQPEYAVSVIAFVFCITGPGVFYAPFSFSICSLGFDFDEQIFARFWSRPWDSWLSRQHRSVPDSGIKLRSLYDTESVEQHHIAPKPSCLGRRKDYPMKTGLDPVGQILGHNLGCYIFSRLLMRHDWAADFANQFFQECLAAPLFSVICIKVTNVGICV